jgi:hypothetical protein
VDLDSRIRDADPAKELDFDAVATAAAREAHRRAIAREHPRRGYILGVSGALLAALAAVLVWLVIPGGPAVTPSSAAAAALESAARATQNAPTLKLGAGQYLYSEVNTLAGSYYTFGNGGPDQRAYVEQQQTIQIWEAADGSEREVWTYDTPQTFATPAGSRAWADAGEPQITPPSNTPTGQEVEYGGPGVLTPPDDLSRLPDDPAALTALIDANETGLSEITSDPTVPVSAAYTFSTAARILATPAFGSSPALRAALYEVLAAVPGVELRGTAIDNSGGRGIEIAGPLGGDGYSQAGGDAGVRDEVIIDPTNGTVLELAQVLADPALETARFVKYIGDTRGQLLDWTDYIASAVVDSPSATTVSPPANGPIKHK